MSDKIEFLRSILLNMEKERDDLIQKKNDYSNRFEELNYRDFKEGKKIAKEFKKLTEQINELSDDLAVYDNKYQLLVDSEKIDISKLSEFDSIVIALNIENIKNELITIEQDLEEKYASYFESEELFEDNEQDSNLDNEQDSNPNNEPDLNTDNEIDSSSTQRKKVSKNKKQTKANLYKIFILALTVILTATGVSHCKNSKEKNGESSTKDPSAASAPANLEVTPTDDLIQTNDKEVVVAVDENYVETYDINTFDNISDEFKLEARVSLIQNEIFRVVEGTESEENVKKVYTTDTISRMINFYNDGSISNFKSGDSLEYHNLLNGLTNLENELNVVMPLYLFLTDGSMAQAVAKEVYVARATIVEGQKTANNELAVSGVSELGRITYETFVMPGVNGSISANYFETAGSKAYVLKYLLASNALAEEVDHDHIASTTDTCDENIEYYKLYEAINEGKAFEENGNKLSIPTDFGADGCFEITYLSSYSLGAEQEILVKLNNQELALQK